MGMRSKTAYLWCAGILVYGLLGLTLFSSLRGLTVDHSPILPETVTEVDSERRRSLVMQFGDEKQTAVEGVLVPVGPDAASMPGYESIWAEAAEASVETSGTMVRRGFDALQGVTDPGELNPSVIFELPLSQQADKVFLRKQYAFMLMSNGMLVVLDMTKPSAPKIVSNRKYGWQVKDMDMQGALAYLLVVVGDRNEVNLLVLDMKNPQRPKRIAERPLPDWSSSLYVRDHELLVVAHPPPKEKEGVFLYEVDREFQLTAKGTVVGLELDHRLRRDGNTFFSADPTWGLRVLDWPPGQGLVEVNHLVLPEALRQIVIRGDRLFAWSHLKRLYTIDVTEPHTPKILRVDEGATIPVKAIFVDDYTYLFDPSGWVKVVDRLPIAGAAEVGPAKPVYSQGVLVPDEQNNGFVLLQQDHGLTTPSDGLPLKHVSAGAVKSPNDACWVNQHLVVLSAQNRLTVLRETEGALRPVSSMALPQSFQWVVAHKETLYLGGEGLVQVVSLGEDYEMTLAGRIDLPDKELSQAVIVEGKLCLAAGRDGVFYYDLGDPTAPTLLERWRLPVQFQDALDVRSLSRCGHKLFAAAGPAGLLTALFEGDQLVLTGHMDFDKPVRSVEVYAGIALVAAGDDVFVVDVRRSDRLQKLAEVDFANVERIAVASPDYWAGYVKEKGWRLVPMPRVLLGDQEVSGAEVVFDLPPVSEKDQYRVTLFNPSGQVVLPGLYSFASNQTRALSQGGPHVP